MAAPPVTAKAFFELVQRSEVVTPKRLEAYLSACRPTELAPTDAARAAITDGLLTRFQAEQLLMGRWRNFLLAGKYLVLERIGHGGSSAIFLAEHLGIRRPVALKILPPNHAGNPEILARFYREAQAAAMLDHPNIADVYDVHRAGERHFLVMEYVHGPDFQGLIRQVGPLPPGRAAGYISQAASGLQHAHEAGLVHRDIKPGNLLVDSSGTVKILDLGLVRISQSDDGLTRGQDFRYVLGTLDYQAPEQAVDSHDVDIRADIYGLGGTLYFLLTGQPPFPEGTIAEKLSWHQRRQPRPIGEYRRDVPAGLTAVVDRMLAKSPSDRYQEPDEVVAALVEWAAGSVPPPDEAELPRLSKASRALLGTRPRSSSPAATLAALRPPSPGRATSPPTATALAEEAEGTAITPGRHASDLNPRKRRFPRRAAIIAAAAAALVIAGAWVNRFVAGSLAQPPSTAAPLVKPSGPIHLLDTVAHLGSQIESESVPTIRGGLLIRRGNVNGRLGRWRQAADDFRRALELDPRGDWTWYAAIPTLAEIGDESGYRELCLEMQRRFGASTDTLLGERIAKLWLLTPSCPGDPTIPRRLLERALADGVNQELHYWVMSTRGIEAYRAGRLADAVSWLKDAIEAAPSNTPQCKALSGLFLSMALSRQDLRDEAREAHARAEGIIERHQSRDGGDLGSDWCDWLMCSIVRRETEKALRLNNPEAVRSIDESTRF